MTPPPPNSRRQSDIGSVVPYLIMNVLLQMSVFTRAPWFLPLETRSIAKRTRHSKHILGIQLGSVLLKHSQRPDRPSADGLISLILTPLQPPLQPRSQCQPLSNLINLLPLPLPRKKPLGCFMARSSLEHKWLLGRQPPHFRF